MSSSSTDNFFDGEGNNERSASQLQPKSAEMEAERQHNLREEGNVEEEGAILYYDYTSHPLTLSFSDP
jgi:hypothetical protein